MPEVSHTSISEVIFKPEEKKLLKALNIKLATVAGKAAYQGRLACEQSRKDSDMFNCQLDETVSKNVVHFSCNKDSCPQLVSDGNDITRPVYQVAEQLQEDLSEVESLAARLGTYTA